MKIKEKYEKICNKYIKLFVKKHGYEFTDWIPCESVGEIACFVEQYYFNLSDIMFDINENLPVGLIFEWQEYHVDQHFNNNNETINLKNYWKGLRF